MCALSRHLPIRPIRQPKRCSLGAAAPPAIIRTCRAARALYADLLLHDLGADAADAFGDAFASAGEWRTAPLMDLDPMSGKRRYLHGGAAANLDQAIRLHGGEAAAARDRYLGLTAAERATLLSWLARL